jgi:hypothetical protein
MKTYSYNKKTKWYTKVNWLTTLIKTILAFGISILILGFISSWNDMYNIVKVSIIIAVLIMIGKIFDDILLYRNYFFMIKDKKIMYLESFDVRKAFVDINNPEDLYKNNNKYEDISRGEILSINSIKKRMKYIVVNAKVDARYWKYKGIISYSNPYVVEEKIDKKIIIRKDIREFEELLKKLESI